MKNKITTNIAFEEMLDSALKKIKDNSINITYEHLKYLRKLGEKIS